jgi:hypothetical protein
VRQPITTASDEPGVTLRPMTGLGRLRSCRTVAEQDLVWGRSTQDAVVAESAKGTMAAFFRRHPELLAFQPDLNVFWINLTPTLRPDRSETKTMIQSQASNDRIPTGSEETGIGVEATNNPASSRAIATLLPSHQGCSSMVACQLPKLMARVPCSSTAHLSVLKEHVSSHAGLDLSHRTLNWFMDPVHGCASRHDEHPSVRIVLTALESIKPSAGPPS